MIRKEMSKEPSRNFFRLFIIILILNIILSLIVYIVSPEQVPLKLTSQGFKGYKNKISVLSPVLIQLISLPIALIFYKIIPIIPAILKIYQRFLQRIYMKYSGQILGRLLLGINPEGLDIVVLVSKYISVFILTMSTLLVPYNLILLGFAFEVANLENYLIAFFILVLILIMPVFRFFSKKLQ